MHLGIEIGGTKLQLGVGDGVSGKLAALERCDVDSRRGAAGILEQIERVGADLLRRYPIERIGYGFGGPIDGATGVVHKSHQVAGWDHFPLGAWTRETFQRPVALGNDCDAAALAEAKWGAGSGKGSLFYVTVGTGIGGGFVVNGKLHGVGRPAVAEIGHLRPGLHADQPDATVESLAAGPGIAAAAQARLSGIVDGSLEMLQAQKGSGQAIDLRSLLSHAREAEREYLADLWDRCGGDLDALTGKHVAQAAAEGNEVARDVLRHSVQALGWAIAQAITLLAPEVVAVGGGVSLIGESFFFNPLREEVARYVFPPLATSFEISPAQLGEEVVVHGALAFAAEG